MKKIILTFILVTNFIQQINACAYWDPEEEYFNLFVQELIHEDEYYPFLFTHYPGFYGKDYYYGEKKETPKLLDENIESWVKYFNNELTYEETNALIKIIRRKHIRNWKKGTLSHVLSKQKGANFYKKYREGFDYLAYAKYLEPYMSIRYVPNEDSWSYYNRDEKELDASDLDYDKVLKVLTVSYGLTENEDIRLRYGYQIVRLNHYTRRYKEAVDAFNKYVKPLKRDVPIFWYAVNQCAGAVRGLGFEEDANQMFFSVFIHSRNKKTNAFSSIKFGSEGKFQKILENATNKEEINMAYFLLAYDNYNNPIPMMEKMIENDAESAILKVLTARAINQMERLHLPSYYNCGKENCGHEKRLPVKVDSNNSYYDFTPSIDYVKNLEKIVEKARIKSKDEFWGLALAHIYFLEKEYDKSDAVLPLNSKTLAYKTQANKMHALNYIVSQKEINAKVEAKLSQEFSDLFSLEETPAFKNDDKTFIKEILANRYYLQGEIGKSFLMNTKVSEFEYNLNLEVLKKVETFIKKKNKNTFEQKILDHGNDMGNALAFFQVIYGDLAMRNADFKQAISHYKKAGDFKGIQREYYTTSSDTWEIVEELPEGLYNGFNHISDYVFGQEKWVSYNSPEHVSIKPPKKEFKFISKKMNKLQLAENLLMLQDIGKGRDEKAVKANTLIGNVLYNTSELGYFRHLFVMDLSNGNGPKYSNYYYEPYFNQEENNIFYAKDFNHGDYQNNHNFDLVISYYQKALKQTKHREEQANILFQMAKAEQGNYYKFKPDFECPDWEEENYSQKIGDYYNRLNQIKLSRFKTYFGVLRDEYSDTQAVQEYRKSCSYFNHYML